MEEVKSQANVGKISINSNFTFNNDANDGNQISRNSIRKKLDSLFEFTYSLVSFLAVSETKLDSSFPTGQSNQGSLSKKEI